MYYAIVRDLDDAVLTTFQADDVVGMPVLDGARYELLNTSSDRDRFTSHMWDLKGRPFNRFEAGTVGKHVHDTRYFISVDTKDEVVGVHKHDNGLPPEVPPGFRVVEIDASTYDQVGSTLHLPQDGGNRWTCDAQDVITEVSDDRFQLDVSIPELVEGTASDSTVLNITFQARDSQGADLSVSREVPVLLFRRSEVMERVVNLVGGVDTVQRTLPAGTYRIGSARPRQYRVTGDAVFIVTQEW